MYLDENIKRRLLAIESLEHQARMGPTTYLSVDRVRAVLTQLSEEGLRVYLDQAILAMTPTQRDAIVGGLVYEQIIRQLDPEEVITHIQAFYQASRKGEFFQETDHILELPEETDHWFCELSTWIDRTCELITSGHILQAANCVTMLQELLDNRWKFVEGHDLGDEMIVTRHDYRTVFQQLP